MTDLASLEQWLPIVGYEGLYEVSSFGRVRSVDRLVTISDPRGVYVRAYDGKILRQQAGRDRRYFQVGLHYGAQNTGHFVHRLVCEAFHGAPPSPEHVVAHGDGDPKNNRATNLRWATKLENMADCVRHGTLCRGEQKVNAKLDAEKVRSIRAAAGVNQYDLARLYGVTQSVIWGVQAGRIWKHVK